MMESPPDAPIPADHTFSPPLSDVEPIKTLLRTSADNWSSFQMLVQILERRGVLAYAEVARIYGETPAGS